MLNWIPLPELSLSYLKHDDIKGSRLTIVWRCNTKAEEVQLQVFVYETSFGPVYDRWPCPGISGGVNTVF